MIKHSRKAFQAAGYDPEKDLIVAFEYTDKRKGE
jgi:hypothetical protein